MARTAQAPLIGFQDKAGVIGFILIIGGAFGIILGSGAVDFGLRYTVSAGSSSRAEWFVIPVEMVPFSLGGAAFGMSAETIPFVLITVPLALKLGYGAITGLCMSWMAAALGFAGAFFNPFTVQVAQGIAEAPVLSGTDEKEPGPLSHPRKRPRDVTPLSGAGNPRGEFHAARWVGAADALIHRAGDGMGREAVRLVP